MASGAYSSTAGGQVSNKMIRYIDFSGLSNESVTILLGIRTYWGASVSVLSQWNARRVVVELPRESILRTMNSRVFDYSR